MDRLREYVQHRRECPVGVRLIHDDGTKEIMACTCGLEAALAAAPSAAVALREAFTRDAAALINDADNR
jgi:hypothetical protein